MDSFSGLKRESAPSHANSSIAQGTRRASQTIISLVKSSKMAAAQFPRNGTQQPELSTGGKCKKFFKKYFLEGQKLDEDFKKAKEELPPDADFTDKILFKHRKLVAFLLPIILIHTVWWCLAIRWNFFALYPYRWRMALTMMFGSFIAGATAEGGGAVAYPVLTLVIHTPSSVARDFSLMIQCFSMSGASFAILFMKLKLEWHSLIFCNIGGIIGLVFGLEIIDPLLPDSVKKLIFVSVWFSFAFALFLLNRQYKRKTFDAIPNFTWWKGLVLFVIGFVGGNFTAIAGSGVDICSFSFLTLLFRVTEKVATPTSVILMAVNTITGFFWRQNMTDEGCEREAWLYLAATVPVSAIVGPAGALFASYTHRQVQAALIYILDTLALITALAVIPMTWQLWLMVALIIIFGFGFFKLLELAGARILRREGIVDDSTASVDSNLNHNKTLVGLDHAAFQADDDFSPPKRRDSSEEGTAGV